MADGGVDKRKGTRNTGGERGTGVSARVGLNIQLETSKSDVGTPFTHPFP